MRPGRYLLAMAALLFGTIAVPAHAATIQITIDNLVFAPAEVSAKVGDTIELAVERAALLGALTDRRQADGRAGRDKRRARPR